MPWIWIVIACILVVAVFQYLQSRNQIFKTLHIPYVPAKLLFGNILDLFGKPLALVLNGWTKRYGSVYGYMEGGRPVMVISDPDTLLELFVRKFNVFHSRKGFPLQPDPDTSENVSVFSARGKRWKRLRSIANPTFSASKLKHMVPTIIDSVDTMIQHMENKMEQQQQFDVYPFYQRLTLDVIARTAFGYQQSLQNEQDDELITLCKSIFGVQTLRRNFFSFLAMIIPELTPFWSMCNRATVLLKLRTIPFFKLEHTLKILVEDRRKHKEHYNKTRLDFIQLLLEAEAEPESLTDEAHALDLRTISYNKRMTSNEIVSQSVVFLIAGYETTSTALGFVTYLLATHAHVQDKLREEINDNWNKEDPLEYDTVMKLKYMECVVKEALRLYPIGSAVQSRTCMEAVRIGDVYIPEGMVVSADVMHLHYSKTLWGEDAHEFRPERHEEQDKKHPMAWIPFGAGPRICIGMRFAQLEEKLALTKLLATFRFIATDKTVLQIKGSQTISPTDVVVKVERL